jgi:U3 small nucleolar RNA-associated protein 24
MISPKDPRLVKKADESKQIKKGGEEKKK